jgi:NAD(P)-dependent dehydrogenase (short-subunit alcohol dehydrogenase family)
MVLWAIAITDRVLPEMRPRKWGRIITSTTSGVVAPIPNLALSKGLRLSLVAWSKTLAHDVARHGRHLAQGFAKSLQTRQRGHMRRRPASLTGAAQAVPRMASDAP